MLLKILIYGYCTGTGSSRKIAEKLESDIFYMFLSGMQRPDFRTISDFRKNKKEYFHAYFMQVLMMCSRLGMVKLGHIAIDGTKMEANAGRKNNRTKEDIIELEKKLREEVREIISHAEQTDQQEDAEYGETKRGDEIPEELTQKEKLLEKLKEARNYIDGKKIKKVNLTDPDARIMRNNTGGLDLCYNAQAAVDADSQVIVAYDVTSKEEDHTMFIPMYEKIVENTGKLPKEVSADAGYHTGLNYSYMERNGIDGYVPDSKMNAETDNNGNEVLGKYDRRNFIRSATEDKYICPEGNDVVFRKKDKRNGIRFRIFIGTVCDSCKKRDECIAHPTAKFRQIQIYENDNFKADMRKKLTSKEGKKIYGKRQASVEPVFAHLKRILNFNRFTLRGIEKVNAEYTLMCTAFNIKKIVKHFRMNAI
jgi:hypothetical protein